MMLPSSGRNIWISPTIGGRLNIMNFLRLNSWLLAVLFGPCIIIESFVLCQIFWMVHGLPVAARWCPRFVFVLVVGVKMRWCTEATYMHEIWMQRATGKDCPDVPVCHRLSRLS